MEKKNITKTIKEYPQIVLRPLAIGLAGLAMAVSMYLQGPQDSYRNHNHQSVRIERTFWDYDKDGKYDEGSTRMTFEDGCVQEEEIPWYTIGRTRRDYEEIYKRIDSMDNPDEIEETLTFKPL